MKKKIMVVDDDRDMLEIIALVVGHAGYEVIESFGGEDCLEKIGEVMPDLLLLDIMMPGLDGWRVLERLRENPQTAPIPVVALTAKSQSIDKMIGLHVMKFDAYLTKPFGRRKLLNIVEKFIS